MKYVTALLLAILPIFSQEKDSSKSLIQAAGSAEVVRGGGTFLVEGFTLVPGGTPIEQVGREHGVHVLFSKGDEPGLVDRLRAMLNRPLDETLIAQLKATIVDFYRESSGLYVAAIIPVQRVDNGVVIVQILDGHVGSIEYTGQKWFSQRVIANALGIRPGDPLIEKEFLNDVTWANRNPFRTTQIVMGPGTEPGVTNLAFITKDQLPLRFYAGVDNTGYISNTVNRWYAGFNWGDALMIGDMLSYQYTASPNCHDLQTHVANYTSFLPWKHVFTVFGTYGTVYPIIPNFKINGLNVQGSTRYQIPIRPFFGSFRSFVELGFDYKFLKSNLLFVGDITEALPSNQIITITEFSLSYRLEKNWPQQFFTFRMDMFLSPWRGWLPHQSASAYHALRPGSHVRYAYWKGAISEMYATKSGYTFVGQVRGQFSTGTLPTAEQFGLGGANTVRGYFDQQFVADNAFVLNLEAYSPTISPFKSFKSALSFLAFFDCGYGYNYTAVSPIFIHQNLMGIGPGIRYDVPPHLNVKLDYGFQVFGIPQDHRFGRLHFSVNASY